MFRTSSNHRFGALFLLTAAALVSTAATANAAEIQLRDGLVGESSSWPKDGAFSGSTAIAVRFADRASIYTLARVGFAGVDQRMLTLISIGGQVWTRVGAARPYLRFGLVHQHEESWAAVNGDVFGAIFGVGDGIRHRAGLEWGLGVDYPFAHPSKNTQFFASAEGLFTWFPDPRGPSMYGGGTLGLGLNYSL